MNILNRIKKMSATKRGRSAKYFGGKKTIILTIAILLLAAPACWAAELIYSEDYDGTTVGAADEMRGWNEVVDELDQDSLNHCGKAYVAANTGDDFTRPVIRWINQLGHTKDFYIKFDVRMDADLGSPYPGDWSTSSAEYDLGNNEVINFKLLCFSEGDDPWDDPWNPVISFEPSVGGSGYSVYHWSHISSFYEEYYGRWADINDINSLYDHNWHTIEVYVHVGEEAAVDVHPEPSGDGILEIKVDGEVVRYDENVPFRGPASEGQGINSLELFRHVKYAGSAAQANGIPMIGHLYVDNIELWDGMPDEQQTVYSGSISAETDKAVYYKSSDQHVLVDLDYENGDEAVDNLRLSIDAIKNNNGAVREDLKVKYYDLGAGESIEVRDIRLKIQSKGDYTLRVNAGKDDQSIDQAHVDIEIR